jgi:FkbM family methyltransferase
MSYLTFIHEVGIAKWFWRWSIRQFSKRVLGRDQRTKLPTGLVMTLPKDSRFAGEVFITNNDVDWGAEKLLAQFARKDCDFLDVGANIGYYSLYFAPLSRRVYSFEPDTRNFRALKENATRATNVIHVQKAVSSQSGCMLFNVDGDPAVSYLTNESTGISVDCTSIDDFTSKNPDVRVGLIKIDIEGRDIDAILGANHTISLFQPLILTELNQADGNSYDKLVSICQIHRYSIFAFYRQSNEAKPKFGELKLEDFKAVRTKMIFLVPPCLRSRFTDFQKAAL